MHNTDSQTKRQTTQVLKQKMPFTSGAQEKWQTTTVWTEKLEELAVGLTIQHHEWIFRLGILVIIYYDAFINLKDCVVVTLWLWLSKWSRGSKGQSKGLFTAKINK